jgi:hypothetical protein
VQPESGPPESPPLLDPESLAGPESPPLPDPESLGAPESPPLLEPESLAGPESPPLLEPESLATLESGCPPASDGEVWELPELPHAARTTNATSDTSFRLLITDPFVGRRAGPGADPDPSRWLR